MSSKLVRLCGLALVVSSVLFVITTVVEFVLGLYPTSSQAIFYLARALAMFAAPLELLGVVGLYLRRPEVMGILGLIAFLVTFLGGALAAGAIWYQLFAAPSIRLVDLRLYELLEIDRPGPFAFGSIFTFQVYYLGWFLFMVAALRARLYPRQAVILLIGLSLLAEILNTASEFILDPSNPSVVVGYASSVLNIFFNAALAWLGFALWRGRSVPEAPQTTRAAHREPS